MPDDGAGIIAADQRYEEPQVHDVERAAELCVGVLEDVGHLESEVQGQPFPVRILIC